MIGPRAEWDKLVEQYEEQFPFYHERHKVAPGITGWAQVNYPYGKNIEDTRQKLMYYFYYIKNWSIWLEIKTIWKTIMVMIGKKGL
jgi:lipopolysaccharide/colanic/teichoic acid biosynthesis glycosyltransferase